MKHKEHQVTHVSMNYGAQLMRQFDAAGMDKTLEAMDTLTQAIEDARPLLHRAIELADQVCAPICSFYSM